MDPERFLHIGTVDFNQAVNARRVEYHAALREDGETPSHAGLGLLLGRRWRYPEGANTVFWWQKPTQDEEHSVDSYLRRKLGVDGLRHQTYLDDSVEDEMSAGHIPLTAKYRLKSPRKATAKTIRRSDPDASAYLLAAEPSITDAPVI